MSAAPGADGIVRRMQQPAREGSTNWAVFALANSGDEQIDRLIVVPHYRMVGSGLLLPDLGLSRIVMLGVLGLDAADDVVVCMPGTHSKWVRANGGTVERFATFMTGELFDVVSRETILSHAVAGADQAEDIDAFKSAVIAAFETPRSPPICYSRCDRASSFTAASRPRPARKYRAP